MEQGAVESGVTDEVEVRNVRMESKEGECSRDGTWEMPSDMG